MWDVLPLHPPSSISGPHFPIRPGVFVFAHIVASYFWSPSSCLPSSLTSHYICVVCNLIPLTAQLTGEEQTDTALATLKLPRNNISPCAFPLADISIRRSTGVGWRSVEWIEAERKWQVAEAHKGRGRMSSGREDGEIGGWRWREDRGWGNWVTEKKLVYHSCKIDKRQVLFLSILPLINVFALCVASENALR